MNKNKWFLNGGRGSGRSFRLLCETYENKIADLEKENAELRNRNQELLESCEGATMMYEHLTKAKEIIQKLIANAPDTYSGTNIELQQRKMFSFQDAENKAEQFLNSEVEECGQ